MAFAMWANHVTRVADDLHAWLKTKRYVGWLPRMLQLPFQL
jgi:hypothetical protein